ncbi:MFS transporter [Novosphingobium sp. ERW19]|uniref:MFS transporter n=1 Tax=Novosphingobium sp. ERW19 TaxID=2726186 RepID=UPI0014569EAE|nr:MFS transporter [Novosphingobium sp. ERW19]NLR39451.1 MFS transporter [Novosphingobium sp. ERW19]
MNDQAHEPRHLPTRKQFAAVISGNALEFYDFLSFSFFAVNVSRVMFPAGAPGSALLLTLMTAGAGFGARPLGAILFGLLGDKVGRRPTMLATFALMGVSAIGLALTPSYSVIGIWAPVLVVIFRLLQGLAAGGDVGPTTAFLAESSPPERRGMLVALQLVAMRIGVLGSGLVGLVLASVLTPAQLDAYGWRIAFAIGAGIVPLAFILRRRLDETLHLPETGPNVVTELDVAAYAAALLGVFGFLLAGATGDFLFVYAVTFLKIPVTNGYVLQMAAAGTQIVGLLFGGWLGDRVGRQKVNFATAVLAAAVSLPLFRWGIAGGTLGQLALAAALLLLMATVSAAVAYAAFVEITPKRHRAGLVGIGYGAVVALTFGLTPVLLTRYIGQSGDLAAPGYAFVLAAAALIASSLLLGLRAPRTLGKAAAT